MSLSCYLKNQGAYPSSIKEPHLPPKKKPVSHSYLCRGSIEPILPIKDPMSLSYLFKGTREPLLPI
jgi:hypothetical protein